jgi:hypothetical protein
MRKIPMLGENMFPDVENSLRRDKRKERCRIFGSGEERIDKVFFMKWEITLDIILFETACKTLDLKEEQRKI